MARFYGKVGYGETAEVRPGVHELVITERTYRGDVIRNTRGFDGGDKVINDITTSTSVSILADAYALSHFFAIQYVDWMGALWVVDNVDVQRPRLILRLGGVYNGPKVAAPSTP